ncbi:MAG: glycosyltransferase family 9 protein [Bacteroidia bacterium]
MKILIIRFSSLGDMVLTTPVLRAIANRYPTAEIHYLTKVQHYEVIKAHPLIKRIHLVNKSGKDLMATLQAEQFDHIIDLHHNLRSRQFKWFLSGKKYSFRKLNLEKWLRVRCGIDILPRVHIVQRYLETLSPLHIPVDPLPLEYFIPHEDQVDVGQLFQSAGLHNLNSVHGFGTEGPLHLNPWRDKAPSFGVYAIGGQHATKRLPEEQMIGLCSAIQRPLFLLGGKADRATADRVVGAAKNPYLHSFCGQFNINQSADVVRQARVLITHDSVMMHIGAAFARPTLAIWGNTIPEFGMYAWQPDHPQNVHQFEIKALKCRPCSKIGFDACPKGHFKCMRNQPIEAICDAFHELMANG